tara:strand:- start:15 stop:350 length:336 start_codon:yes stop_codon:yes gene_type:complete
MIRALVHISGLSLAVLSAIWCVVDFNFISASALLTALFGYGTFVMKEKVKGRGGNAITTGKGSSFEMENYGQVEGGEGGSGGNGGDAIHVTEGVKINITNRGTIKGGNAGK